MRDSFDLLIPASPGDHPQSLLPGIADQPQPTADRPRVFVNGHENPPLSFTRDSLLTDAPGSDPGAEPP